MAPPAPPPAKGDKKSAPNTAGVITSPSKTAQTPSHMYSAAPSPVINPLLSNILSVSICLCFSVWEYAVPPLNSLNPIALRMAKTL